MDLVSAAAGASSALDLVSKLKGLVKGPERELVLDLQERINNLREGLAFAAEENLRLRAELCALKEREALRQAFEIEDETYALRSGVAGRLPGNYCTRCMDVEERAVRLAKSDASECHRWACPQCKGRFGTQTPDLSGYIQIDDENPWLFGPRRGW